jgi:hypothetical protein
LSPAEADRGELGRARACAGRLGGEHVGEGGEVLDDLRGEVFEEREELAPDADAREARVQVAGVRGEGEAVAIEVRGDVRSARPEERADELRLGGVAGGDGITGEVVEAVERRRRVEERGRGREGRARREHGETSGPGAAQEAKEERLGPVVGGVPRGDSASARVFGGVPEGGEAGGPRPSLEV